MATRSISPHLPLPRGWTKVINAAVLHAVSLAAIRRAGQGIQSLQTALHAAGARTAITSLWKVDDAATRKLMELFYTYLWVEKLPVAEALWKAKTDMRKAGHPRDVVAGPSCSRTA